MKHIQNIVQTQNEKQVSYLMLFVGAISFVLFVAYVCMVYQVTHVGYAISKQEREASAYLDTVASLENAYHAKKSGVTEQDASLLGFAKIDNAHYVTVNTETYSLAR